MPDVIEFNCILYDETILLKPKIISKTYTFLDFDDILFKIPCPVYPSWETASHVGPHSEVVFLQRFHCISVVTFSTEPRWTPHRLL